MSEPFKNVFSEKLVRDMGTHFTKAWPAFDQAGFNAMATKGLEALELKERSEQITAAMFTFLPSDFERTAELMLVSLAPEDDCDVKANIDSRGIVGWAVMPMTHYVGLYGHEHFGLSMTLLKEMTKRFSSEFGIRFFLLKEPERTLSVLERWTRDPSLHVRRLVSEGTRPRLPWAMRLPAFIESPSPLIPLLESLKDDPEEYVRRSVANNLNDIAKDHPNLVASLAGTWLKNASKDRERLVWHACRTLIKQGHNKALTALGYWSPSVEVKRLTIVTPQVLFGDRLEFELVLISTLKRSQALIIDYAIHHRKANGQMTPKVFKWKSLVLDARTSHTAQRKHGIRKITTRVYYPGTPSGNSGQWCFSWPQRF